MRILAIAACILLTGCAASRTGALPASQTASATPSLAAPVAADEAEIHVAREIDLNASGRDEEGVVCRREAPLGSRISVTRCDPVNRAGTAAAALDEQQRHDLEEMRRQRQLLLEQQRMQSALGGPQP